MRTMKIISVQAGFSKVCPAPCGRIAGSHTAASHDVEPVIAVNVADCSRTEACSPPSRATLNRPSQRIVLPIRADIEQLKISLRTNVDVELYRKHHAGKSKIARHEMLPISRGAETRVPICCRPSEEPK